MRRGTSRRRNDAAMRRRDDATARLSTFTNNTRNNDARRRYDDDDDTHTLRHCDARTYVTLCSTLTIDSTTWMSRSAITRDSSTTLKCSTTP
eukprot:1193987-Rhodomonas_salina.3